MVIVWLSVDKQAALDMAMLYARDSLLHGWWDAAELILWGPSVKAVDDSEPLQQELALMQHVGVRVSACLACAVRYGVTEHLTALGIEVRGMGEPLTEYLKSGAPVLFI